MPEPARADRQVARFEEGDLWREGEASPPESPAGFYFRPRGAVAGAWVGPYPTAEDAGAAPCRGDPLAAARRRLDEWARARARSAPSARVLPVEGAGRRAAAAGQRPVEPSVGGPAPRVAPPRPLDPAGERPAGDASATRQLALDLGAVPDAAAEGDVRPPSGRGRRRTASGPAAAVQGVLPLDADEA